MRVINKEGMPQFSPIWFINTISWGFAILSFLVYFHQAISFPAMLHLQLSRILLCIETLKSTG